MKPCRGNNYSGLLKFKLSQKGFDPGSNPGQGVLLGKISGFYHIFPAIIGPVAQPGRALDF